MSQTLPAHYLEARTRFLEAARRGHDVSSYVFAGLTGPQGEELACDVAIQVPAGAEIALVTSSAVHGVEGYAGSALQKFFMEQHAGQKIATIHVHALNPVGFAYDRRADADNFDVNRNFLGDYSALPLQDDYLDYAHIIVPSPKHNKLLTEAKLAYYALTQSDRMKDIITRGQASCEKGMYYTGRKPSWSRGVWERIISEHLSNYTQVIHLDVHSGLGDYGAIQMMGASAQDHEAPLARAAWGDDLAFLRNTDGSNGTLSSTTVGEIQNSWGLVQGKKPQRAASFTMEFGTLPPLDVFKALRADHAAHARGETDPDILGRVRACMRGAFAPSEALWLEKVLQNGGRAYASMLGTLESGFTRK